jgi:hypothetical protein
MPPRTNSGPAMKCRLAKRRNSSSRKLFMFSSVRFTVSMFG